MLHFIHVCKQRQKYSKDLDLYSELYPQINQIIPDKCKILKVTFSDQGGVLQRVRLEPALQLHRQEDQPRVHRYV